MRTLSPLSIALAVALVGCTKPEPEQAVSVQVDATLEPTHPELAPHEDGVPRPVAAVVDQDGHAVDFVEDELVIASHDEAFVAGFAERWGGTVVYSTGAEDGDRLPPLHVVRIDTSLADHQPLPDDLVAMSDAPFGSLTFSSEAGRALFAAAAAEARAGETVAVNWVMEPAGYDDRQLTEAPYGPANYDPNPFLWSYMQQGGTQDIGVGEAWRGLHLATGMAGDRIKIAVIDQGFEPDADFPPWTAWSIVPGDDPIGEPYFGGGWHGTRVVGAAAGRVDNSYGAAGPGGPVSEVVTIHYAYEQTSAIAAILLARSEGADIINMSFGARVPTIVAWTVYPFEWATMDAWDHGALIFASAGNDGENVDADHIGPLGFNWGEKAWHAPCENNSVICVGGIGWDTTDLDGSSNYGHEHVDIYAPFNIFVGPDPDHPATDQAYDAHGTSFSSPFTAGVAALVWAASPGLSNDGVWNRLRDTAHDSPDGRVKRYVHAETAVNGLFDEQPPWVDITSPPEGSEWLGGWPIPLEATSGDLEDGVPEVVWSSDADGLIGVGHSIEVDDLSYGTQVVEAVVFDLGGNISYDTVTFEVTNALPEVTLIEPPGGSEFVTGEPVHLRANSTDLNEYPTFELPDSALVWSSSLDGALGQGHELTTTALGAGSHTITVTATDDYGAVATDSVLLDVIPGTDLGPVVTILTPPDDVDSGDPDWIDWQYDGVDPSVNMPYKDVLLVGSAEDPEDGTLGGTSLVWTTDRTDLQTAQLGTGTSIVARLYGDNPCSDSHTITLTATDSYGNVRQAVRIIAMWAVC